LAFIFGAVAWGLATRVWKHIEAAQRRKQRYNSIFGCSFFGLVTVTEQREKSRRGRVFDIFERVSSVMEELQGGVEIKLQQSKTNNM
jgi:hypothetical protein